MSRDLYVVKARTLGTCVVITLPKALRANLDLKSGHFVTLEGTEGGFRAIKGAPKGAIKVKEPKPAQPVRVAVKLTGLPQRRQR